jgi:outer membrane biosynthesis protein TonB
MTPLAVGPLLALVGIVAAFFVLRGKAKTRKSMYRTLRERRELDLRKARERATAAKGSAERAAMEREAAAQSAASGPAAAAVISPVEAAPAYTPPPPEIAPPPAATPQEPAYPPQQPTYSPPEPLPTPPPVEQAPVAPLPEPPPTAGDQTKPSWEIVQPEKPEAESIHAAEAEGAAAGKASWELDPRERQRIDDRHKGRGRHEEEEEEDDLGQESLAQVLLSYAGLVVALLVILLGILFMIGGRH